MSELNAKHVADVYDDYAERPCDERSQVYLKSEADAAIAEKDAEIAQWKDRFHDLDNQWNEQCKEIADLKAKLEDAKATAYAESVDAGMRERKLRRSLLKACENWAWAEHVRYVDISDGSQGYKQAQERWDKMARKCREKADEWR